MANTTVAAAIVPISGLAWGIGETVIVWEVVKVWPVPSVIMRLTWYGPGAA